MKYTYTLPINPIAWEKIQKLLKSKKAVKNGTEMGISTAFFDDGAVVDIVMYTAMDKWYVIFEARTFTDDGDLISYHSIKRRALNKEQKLKAFGNEYTIIFDIR